MLAAIVSNMEPYFISQGLDFAELAAEASITRESLTQADNFVSLSGICRLLEMAAARAGDRCFGLHCAEAYPMSAVSILGYILMNAPTTLDALTALQRYARLIVAPIRTSCREEDGRLYWARSYPAGFKAPRLQFDLFSTAIVIRRLRHGAGANWSLDDLEFDHPDPGCPADCARLLAPRITYSRPQTVLIMDISKLKRDLKNADHKLFGILKKHAETLLLQQPDPNDIVALTRHQIELLLHGGKAELDSVAAALRLSVRSLRARLAKSGTTFTSLLDDVRKQKAQYYLQETDMQITEAAYLLGFSDLSAFTHAAVRWFGRSPSAYRMSSRAVREEPRA